MLFSDSQYCQGVTIHNRVLAPVSLGHCAWGSNSQYQVVCSTCCLRAQDRGAALFPVCALVASLGLLLSQSGRRLLLCPAFWHSRHSASEPQVPEPKGSTMGSRLSGCSSAAWPDTVKAKACTQQVGAGMWGPGQVLGDGLPPCTPARRHLPSAAAVPCSRPGSPTMCP